MIYQQKMNTVVQQAVSLALKRLVTNVARNGHLVIFETRLQQRKHYDQCERQYIQNQRLRNQLGSQYESSDSEEEKENTWNDMTPTDLKRILRKQLLERKFDQGVLVPIQQNQQPEQENQEFVTVKNIAESSNEINQTELNIIREARQPVEEEEEKQTNFGLEFLIRELENINQSRQPSMKSNVSVFSS